jgi:hypothetical protein
VEVFGLLVGPPESATVTPAIVGPETVPEIVQFVEQPAVTLNGLLVALVSVVALALSV